MKDAKLFASVLKDKDILDAEEDMQPFLQDWRGHYTGVAQAVLLPHTTQQVAAILELADAHDIVIVPQGGNTGLVGGGIPDQSGKQVILSLTRMKQVRELSRTNRSMIVEAGCLLQDLHEVAEKNGFYFPLNLASKGSCTIGGNLATNAGGLNVLRYGTMRELCLGIEVVLLGGQVMHGLTSLRKDNTGYDLKNLFIGSEGTLGVITAASLKLYALPQARATAFVAVANLEVAVELLHMLQQASAERVEAFEIMPATLLKVVFKQFPAIAPPLKTTSEFVALIEVASSAREDEQNCGMPVTSIVESVLNEALEAGMISEAVVAQNTTQRQQLWDIREHAPLATKRESHPVNTDISVTLDDLQKFYDLASQEVKAVCPDARICCYGHLGDGNLHFNLIEAEGGDPHWAQKRESLRQAIYRALSMVHGSISAEHGIGELKYEQLKQTKDPVALRIMSGIKQQFDPKGLLNPGKVIS